MVAVDKVHHTELKPEAPQLFDDALQGVVVCVQLHLRDRHFEKGTTNFHESLYCYEFSTFCCWILIIVTIMERKIR